MTISKAMKNYKDLPRCLMDYVRGAYKRALEKQQPTLPFSLLKVAVERARTALAPKTALANTIPANTIHVKPQQAVTRTSKVVEVVMEARIPEQEQVARKASKGKGKEGRGRRPHREDDGEKGGEQAQSRTNGHRRWPPT